MTNSRRTDVLLFIVLALIALCAWLLGSTRNATAAGASPASSPAASAPSSTTQQQGIQVSAVGKVTGRPDVLRIDLGVDVSRPTVDQALNQANAAMSKLRNALVRNGVKSKDLQTSDVSISPEYDSKGRAITSYIVHEGLTVKIRDLRHAGRTIDAAAKAGGNATRINGVSFAIEDNATLLAQARKQAFADAKAKAQLYADAAGRPLGVVSNVVETVNDPTPVEYRQAAPMASDAVADMAVDPGQQQLAVTVTVDWAFG